MEDAPHAWGVRHPGWDYTRTVATLLDRVWPALAAEYKVVIYNGDVDACVPFTGGQDWTTGLAADQAWPQTSRWAPWHVNYQVAGYTSSWASPHPKGFHFLTVKGAGHMVPGPTPPGAV